MKEEVRRAVAFSAAAQINNYRPSSIYSYERRKYTHMSQDYDYEAKAHYSFSGSDLYHYGTRKYAQLNVNGQEFSGYDYDTRSHFSGSVSGQSVTIYDYGERRYFNYSV